MNDVDERDGDALVPQDEALVHYAHILHQLIEDAIDEFPLRGKTLDDEPGAFLRAARTLHETAASLMEAAVVVEIERAASWGEVGDVLGGVSKQSARERWTPTMALWSQAYHRQLPDFVRHDFGRRRTTREVARDLDGWYQQLQPKTAAAVTSALVAAADEGAVDRRAANALRAEARRLHKQLDELYRTGSTELFNDFFVAEGEAKQTARDAYAGHYESIAALYDQLAKVDPGPAQEYRERAGKARELARGIRETP